MTFVGELKRAPMHGDASAGADIAVDLHGLGRVAMLGAHEPTGFVGTDRHEGEIRLAETISDFGEKSGVVTGVTDKIEALFSCLEVKTAPQTAAAASSQSVAPMLGRRDGDGQVWCVWVVLPPVEFYNAVRCEARSGEQVAVAERREGEQIAVVVVIVA